MLIETEKIYEILSKYYKEHSSLYLTREAKSYDSYFYNFSCPESVQRMIDAMNAMSQTGELEIKTMEGKLYDKTISAFRCDEYMVKVHEHETVNSNYISINFYGITGIVVKRVYKKYHAKLTYNPKHILSIYINCRTGDMYGRGVRNGTVYPMSFSPYINKLLMHSPVFKDIFKELLMLCSEGKHIMKDIVRTLDEDGYLAMPITVFDIKKYRTKDKLVRGFTETDLTADFNKQSLNQAYLFAQLSKVIPPGQIGYMMQLDRKKVVDILGDVYREVYPLDDFVGEFIVRYYMDKLRMENTRWNRILIQDYLRLARDHNAPISINFRSVNRLVREHNNLARLYGSQELSAEISKPLIAKNTRFEELRELLPEEFEWIKTNARLQEEGDNQHNCVFSYRYKIQGDESTIYHWSREGREYTIEFGWAPEGKFTIEQMLRSRNREAVKEDVKYVEELLGKRLGKPSDRPRRNEAFYDRGRLDPIPYDDDIFGELRNIWGEDVPF